MLSYICCMKNNIQLAIAEAKRKQELGLLVWDEIPDQEEHTEEFMKEWWSTPNGDRETIYSIAALYSSENIGGEGTENEIIDALTKEFPKMVY